MSRRRRRRAGVINLQDAHVILRGGQLLNAILQRARRDCTEAIAIRSQFPDVDRSGSREGKEPDCDSASRNLQIRLQCGPPEATQDADVRYIN